MAFIPGVPRVELDSHVVLLVFVPPLLMSAGWSSSPRELRAESRALGFLALALVLATTSLVAVAAHELVDGMTWPAAFMLGAVIAPTDAVAAVATFSSVRVPDRVRRLVEGESLINDATGLTGFRVALGAATAGTFSLLDATVDFILAAVGGVVVGAVVAKFFLTAIRKQSDVTVSVLLTILAAYASYIAAEEIHASGILAAATCGVVSGWKQSDYFDADTRLTATAFWRILTFGLEAMLFILLGLQLEEASEGVDDVGTLIGIGVVLAGLTIRRADGLRAAAGGARARPARAGRGRLVRHAGRDLAGRGALDHDRHPGPRRGGLPHVHRDPRDAGGPGPDAARGGPRARSSGRSASGRRRRRSPAWKPRRRRWTASTSSTTTTGSPRSRCGACASSTAPASSSAWPCSAARRRPTSRTSSGCGTRSCAAT